MEAMAPHLPSRVEIENHSKVETIQRRLRWSPIVNALTQDQVVELPVRKLLINFFRSRSNILEITRVTLNKVILRIRRLREGS